MVKVKILKGIYIQRQGLKFRAGDEVDVSNEVAERHVKTGYMKIIAEPKPSPELASKSKKK